MARDEALRAMLHTLLSGAAGAFDCMISHGIRGRNQSLGRLDEGPDSASAVGRRPSVPLVELTPGWCCFPRDIFFSLKITESSSSIMDMLSVQAVLVAQSAVLLDGLVGIIHSHSKPQAMPCKKRCWNIDNSVTSNSSASGSLRFDRFFHIDICSKASPLNVLARCTAHENLMVSIESR